MKSSYVGQPDRYRFLWEKKPHIFADLEEIGLLANPIEISHFADRVEFFFSETVEIGLYEEHLEICHFADTVEIGIFADSREIGLSAGPIENGLFVEQVGTAFLQSWYKLVIL